jgi:hypothetical protein
VLLLSNIREAKQCPIAYLVSPVLRALSISRRTRKPKDLLQSVLEYIFSMSIPVYGWKLAGLAATFNRHSSISLRSHVTRWIVRTRNGT